MLAGTTSAVAGKTETDNRAYTPARVAYSPKSKLANTRGNVWAGPQSRYVGQHMYVTTQPGYTYIVND